MLTARSARRRTPSITLFLLLAASAPWPVAPSPVHAAVSPWSLLHGPLDAPPGTGHAAVYDASRRRMLTLGYTSGAVYEMALDGPAEWRLLATSGEAPKSWGEGSAVLDTRRDRLLWFGGRCDAVIPCPTSEVRVLGLAGRPTWSTLAVTGAAPPARFGHAAVYDAAHDRMVIYGGQNSSRQWLGDVWALSLGGTPAWSEITPASRGPGARLEMGAVYDPVRERMLVHGGSNFVFDPQQPTGGVFTVFNDVWALSLDDTPAWTLVPVDGGGCPPRYAHTLTYDPDADRLLVFGGLGANPAEALFAGVWSLSLGGFPSWLHIVATGDVERYSHAAIFDPARDRLIVQGGYAVGGRVDELSLRGTPSWTQLAPPEPPEFPGRMSARASFYDAKRGRFLLVDPRARMWSWSEREGWARVEFQEPLPQSTAYADPAYDEKRDRLLLLSGDDRAYRGGLLDQIIAVDLSGVPSWSRLQPAGVLPSGRAAMCAGYDPVRDRVIVTGGAYEPGPSGYDVQARTDTWSLSLATLTWERLPVEPAVPLRRAFAPLVYDAEQDAMVLFGGAELQGYFEPMADGWALKLSDPNPVWTSLGPSAPVEAEIPTRWFTELVDLPHGRLLALSLTARRAFVLPLAGGSTWTPIELAGDGPVPRYAESLVLDPVASRALLFGGGDGSDRGDFWALDLDQVTTVTASLASAEARPDQVALVWTTSLGSQPVTVERAPGASRGWQAVGSAIAGGDGRVEFVDRSVEAGRDYDYRLAFTSAGGRGVAGFASVGVPHVTALALAGARPNPGPRGLRVAFTLLDAAPATLEVLDVSGRRILAREVGGLGEGSHTLELGRDRKLPAGLYLLRLRQRGVERVARAVVVD